MSGKLFIIFLLGVYFLHSVEGTRRGPPPRQRDVVEEESCEDDGGDGYDADGKPNRVGATRPRNRPQDDWDGVEDPTEDDYLRYENTNQEGICLLHRGKCPAGDWRMFKRHNETVCLKIFGTQHVLDARAAGDICRKNSNARMMMVDSHEEREWIYNTELGGNYTYLEMYVAGYRTRKCKQSPCTKDNAFEEVDGTSDYKYINARWELVHNAHEIDSIDNCLAFHTFGWTDENHSLRDQSCYGGRGVMHMVLCGVTVM